MSRHDLVQNAVNFLQDPNSQNSTLAQRIQFLEAKGLTPVEIDDAIKQSSQNHAPRLYQGPVPGAPYSFGPQAAHQWDWRDYFITAVMSGAVTYTAVSLFKKYLQPHLQPPTTTIYEDDRDALTAQFDAAEERLKEIQAETEAIRASVDAQHEKIEQTTSQVQSVVQDMKEGEQKTRNELREIREEIDTVREMLPKMIEKNKEAQTQSLTELQQELKSLKALLLTRGPSIPGIGGHTASSPSGVSLSSLPTTPSRPAIPAWQLASPPAPAANGTESDKGKAPEMNPYPPPSSSSTAS